MFHYDFGRFDDGARYAVAPNPTAVSGGLFRSGVARPDVAVVSAGNATSAGTVSVFFNDGSGRLSLSKTYAVGIAPAYLIATDINKDGKLDLISANRGGNSVSVLLGNGDGTFQAAITSAAGSGPVWIAVGDVNNDGNPDLVVANRDSDAYSVLLGNGSGSFQAIFSSGVQRTGRFQ